MADIFKENLLVQHFFQQ